MELAIDTSTSVASIALADKGRVLAEATWRAEFNHTVQLMSAVQGLLRQSGVKAADLAAIAVAIGPGSFSGLRVGLAAAKGFALALGLPVVGIGTLLVEAYPFLGARVPVRPLLSAGKGTIATALYGLGDDGPVEITAPGLMTVEGACAATSGPTLFCGEFMPAVRDQIAASLGALALFPAESALLRRAGNLAELAWRRLARGQIEDAATIQPLYLRAPSISAPRQSVAQFKR